MNSPIPALILILNTLLATFFSFSCYIFCDNDEVKSFIGRNPFLCMIVWPLFALYLVICVIKGVLVLTFRAACDIFTLVSELYKSLRGQ